MKKNNFGEKLTAHIKEYAVTYMFIAISIFFFAVSDQELSYTVTQLILRLNRNAFIVLALIIPIVAGMGINFAITIGAMAAQIGMLLALNWGVSGWLGILLAAAADTYESDVDFLPACRSLRLRHGPSLRVLCPRLEVVERVSCADGQSSCSGARHFDEVSSSYHNCKD